MLGLKRGTVKLYDHQIEWEDECTEQAAAYEELKIDLAEKYPGDRGAYTHGKEAFIAECLFEAGIFAEMRQKIDIIVFSPVSKGWSGDKKYYIETSDGKKLLLRVADIAEFNRKKAEFEMMKRVSALGVPMSRPVDFEVCNGGGSVYSLLTWCDGEDVETVLPTLTETEQYALGLKAGELLRKIHTLPAPEDAEPWGVRFRRKVQGRIDFYNAHPIKSESGDLVIRYLLDNQCLLDARGQTFNHGDYNTTNLIVTPDDKIGVIDFNCFNLDHGDPWWEFCSVAWGQEINAYFSTGLFNGYFNDKPPIEFFRMQAYYFAYDALAALCSTAENDGGEPEDGRRHMENILRWFGNMQNPVPAWYLKDFDI